MADTILIRNGLNIPIGGRPVQDIKPGPKITKVGLVGEDYLGLRPTMLVKVGERVRLGQPLFNDKKTEGFVYTSPAAGRVTEINRGEKRRFTSIVVEIDGNDEVHFEPIRDVLNIDNAKARELLARSGLWPSIRTRPFSKVPSPRDEPHSIFVTAMDTNPLAPEPELIINDQRDFFVAGVSLISRLTRGKTYVCTRDDSRVPGREIPGVSFQSFDGPHPAGLVGTHIHFLDPVSAKKSVWHVGYQDAIAIGHLALTGRLRTERIVSVAGPRVRNPALYRTRLGADLLEIVSANADLHEARVISGSILSGRKSEPLVNYLGRYHNQVVVLEEGTKRVFLGWQRPGADKFSVTRAFLGSWMRSKLFPLTTNLEGGKRAIVPIGTYERVMPLDLMPTHLLKSLIVQDTESAQALGCLELDEEDLGLCTFVCPGKYDHGRNLRENLTMIEKEG